MRLACFYITLFYLLFIVLSCSKLNGHIEIRGENIFLVNYSQTKAYRFTLKRTETINNKNPIHNIEFVELQPGEEINLGRKTLVTITYPILTKKNIQLHEFVTKERIAEVKAQTTSKKKEGTHNRLILSDVDSWELFKNGPDTMINGKHFKYRWKTESYADTAHPYSPEHRGIEYKVTGEVELDNSRQ